MSLRDDGKYRCDRSGRELENGGVHESVMVAVRADLVTGDPEDRARVQTLHFCIADGCAKKVLSKRNLADWEANR